MPDEPLSSPRAYELYVYGLSERHPSIQRSTLVYIPSGALFGRVEGMVFFEGQIVLCVQEFLNFETIAYPCAHVNGATLVGVAPFCCEAHDMARHEHFQSCPLCGGQPAAGDSPQSVVIQGLQAT